jgi:undecaprenyl-diphosphatase
LPILHIFVLALVQGITEFFPVSSSGHLILVPLLTGWQDQGIVIDVSLHVGTLLAVLVYFYKDALAMAVGVVSLLLGRSTEGARLALKVLIATVPAVITGVALHNVGTAMLRNMELVAWMLILFGILMGVADRYCMAVRKVSHLGIPDAVVIGIAQAVALIPGVSRSGITMTAGRALGMERSEAARFSLLLAIPTIIGAAAFEGLTLARSGDLRLGADAGVAVLLAFMIALVAIAVLMRWVRRATLLPFVLYRLALGAGLLALVYL